MLKQTIEVSRDPVRFSAAHKQLLIKRAGHTTQFFPFEDLGLVVVDQPQATYTHAALQSLVASGGALVVCGKNHLPTGVLLPLGEHSEIVWRVRDQIDASLPLKKRLWQQIVAAKILAQASNLQVDSVTRRKMIELSRTVRSGDPANHEAQAAKVYWSEWLSDAGGLTEKSFRRDPEGTGPNSLLNYGYAVLRAAVARAVVSAGLTPVLGIHHSNRGNAYCLADDLMEPLRPLVDRVVRTLWTDGQTEVCRESKQHLLAILTAEVITRDQYGPLSVGLHRYVMSLVKCFRGEAKTLEIPKLADAGANAF